MDTAPPAASSEAPKPVPPPIPAPAKPTIFGEWERRSEPYRGMRIALVEGDATARVTRPSSADATAKNKAQLDCQRSLWKAGDVLVKDFDGVKGTIVVRDWGLTQGVCRHRDERAPATVALAGEDVLAIAVTRGKTTVTQEWTRVR